MAGNIKIIEPQDKFQKVSRSIILDKDVDALTLGIYVKILTLGKEWNLNINGLSTTLHISTDKIRKSFATLEKTGYLKRTRSHDAGGHFSGWDYYISSVPFTDIANLPTSVKTDIGENRHSENTDIGEKTMYNNKTIKEDKETINKSKDPKDIFVPPTSQDVSKYARERGFIDPDGFAFYFIQYYADSKWHLSTGKPMKDWKAAVRNTWEPNNKMKKYPARPINDTEISVDTFKSFLKK